DDLVTGVQTCALPIYSLAGELKARAGDTYDAALVEKTVDDLTIALAKRGQPFAAVRATAVRNPQARTIDLVFAIEPAPPRYVEQIGRASCRDRAQTR